MNYTLEASYDLAMKNLSLTLTLISFSAFAEPFPQYFQTRLNPKLSFEGTKCFGGEEVEIMEDEVSRVISCEKDQWIITVDNKNYCNEEFCTEIYNYPFTAELKQINFPSAAEYTFHSIVPFTKVDESTQQDLRTHIVRFDPNGEPVVLPSKP